jgi:hypothetical protein
MNTLNKNQIFVLLDLNLNQVNLKKLVAYNTLTTFAYSKTYQFGLRQMQIRIIHEYFT